MPLGSGLPGDAENWAEWRPRHDARFDAFCSILEDYLRNGGGWLADERLIVFTEYKTTLDYLVHRLRERYPDEGAILSLFGGCDLADRERVKKSFNDPADPVRVLIATDTGSEGQNLQDCALPAAL